MHEYMPSLPISAPRQVQVQPIGRWFEAYCLRRRHKQTLSHHSLNSSSSDESTEDANDDEDDANLLHTLDPKDWKVYLSHATK